LTIGHPENIQGSTSEQKKSPYFTPPKPFLLWLGERKKKWIFVLQPQSLTYHSSSSLAKKGCPNIEGIAWLVSRGVHGYFLPRLVILGVSYYIWGRIYIEGFR